MHQTSNKLALVLGTSILVTDTSGKKVVRVLCIHYPFQFQKNQEKIRALLNSGSKVNAMSPAFAQNLGFHIRKTNVGAQKIDSAALETFKIVIADLEVENKAGKSRFFQETFLIADTKFEAVLQISFLKISNANILFGKETLM